MCLFNKISFVNGQRGGSEGSGRGVGRGELEREKNMRDWED